MIDGVEVVHHVDNKKVPIPLIILHSPDRHRLQILNLTLRNHQIDRNLDIPLGSRICLDHVIFLLETPLKYYKHRNKVLVLTQLSILDQLYLFYRLGLVVSRNAYHVAAGRYPAELYL
jgi:hypothetical protein